MRRAALILLGLVALQLPWLARPVHYDEANFLVLARGAAMDPWRPHAVRINWQGTEEQAFSVLSNPPGIAWWLAPVRKLPVPAQRLWMLLWTPLALWGALTLSRRVLGPAEPEDPERATTRGALLLLTSPIVLLSMPALLPDGPLYALTLAGVGGFVDRSDRHKTAWPFAMLAGCAALFRYSGVTLPLVLAAFCWSRGRRIGPALFGFVPIVLLGIHDELAYGQIHLLAMGTFQSVANTGVDLAHKAVSALAMLGGAAALPLFVWGRPQWVGAAVGAAAGAAWGPLGALFSGLGGAALMTRLWAPVRKPGESLRNVWLGLWALGGLVFLVGLRFTATRYWLPFLPAVILSFPMMRPAWVPIAAGVGLGTLLAADELQSARAQERLADEVSRLGVGGFTGHWGWQWAMEQRGWKALDEGTRAPAGALVALPTEAWPQPIEARCDRVVWEGTAWPQLPWLPRGYSHEGAANLHANWIVGEPPERTVVPWTFARDPYERVKVCRE